VKYEEIYSEHNYLLSEKSDYLKKSLSLKELSKVKSELQNQREIEKAVAMIDEQLDRLETAVRAFDKSLYHKLIILRRCSLMDSMPADKRRRSLEFGNAMTALEGIPASDDAEKMLSLWVAGQNSFKDSYLQILKKYHLIEV